jgi:hypothetical protein
MKCQIKLGVTDKGMHFISRNDKLWLSIKVEAMYLGVTTPGIHVQNNFMILKKRRQNRKLM